MLCLLKREGENEMETTQPITKTSRTIAVILLIALITAISSEFKITPI